MERKLYRGIMTPSLVLTVGFGIWLACLLGSDWVTATNWFQVKLLLVAVLVVYHFYLGSLVKTFARDRNRRSHVFYRWINEFPVVILIAVVILAVVKPVL